MKTEAVPEHDAGPPRTLRWTLPWLLLAGLATLFYAGSVPDLATGDFLATEYSGRGVGGGVKALVLLLPALGIAFVGLVASIAVVGPRGVPAALRYLVGRAREAELPLAASALGAAARLVLHFGVLAGFLALLAMLDLLRTQAPGFDAGAPADFERTYAHMELVRRLLFLAVPGALLAGRFLLGAPAEAAALRAGVRPPTFSVALQLATLLLIPIFCLLTFVRYPTIG